MVLAAAGAPLTTGFPLLVRSFIRRLTHDYTPRILPLGLCFYGA